MRSAIDHRDTRRLLLRLGAAAVILAWVGITIWTAPGVPAMTAAVGLRARPAAGGQGTRPQAGVHLATRSPVFAPARPQDVLYDQSTLPGLTGVNSQQFEPAFSSFDSESGDDFLVPAGQSWLINEIDVGGSYANGPGPATAVTVRVYSDNGGRPDSLLYNAPDLPYTPGPGYGDLNIPLSSPLLLPPGDYWLVVQARMDVGTQGQWYWTDSVTALNNPAVWRNPGGGYSSWCVDWHIHGECNFPYFEPDSLFRLNGTVALPPSPSATATVPAPSPTATTAAPSPTATASATLGTPTETVTGTPPTAVPTATATTTTTPSVTATPSQTFTPLPPTVTPRPATVTPTAPTATITVTATPGLPLPVATAPIGDVTPPVPPACGLAWRAAVPASLTLHYNDLNGIAVISPSELWAVGFYSNGNTPYLTLIEHWDGSAWSAVASPNPWPGSNVLTSVTVVAPNDAWAVGYGYSGTAQRTLIEHWDGSTWTVIPSPNVGSYDNTLRGVTAAGADSLWAVGDYSITADYSPRKTLILHWTGTSWSQVPSPNPSSQYNALNGVSARSATDVWATGYTFSDRGQALMLHWDGNAWSQVPSPAGSICSSGDAISARAANDVWAVGSAAFGGYCDPQQPAAFHWDGSQWSAVAVDALPTISHLTGVVALAADNVWAVGWSRDFTGRVHTLIAHWTGTGFQPVPSYDHLPANSLLGSIAAVSPTDIWAAGYSESANTRLLAERYHDPCVIPSPTPSNTPSPTVTPPATATTTGTATPTAAATLTVTPTLTATPTATATLTVTPTPPATMTVTATWTATAPATPSATLSLTATATPCPIRFSDVTDPATYYYQGVYYLACHGVISGYSDGTFRPFNTTTRAQMTKIVTLAFNLVLIPPPAGGSFADVDSANVFYGLIETALAHGIVSGYTCGGGNPQTGQAEPCDSRRRPYFRPANSVTRGQLTKIVVSGAGWTVRNPALPTFTDVATDNIFYGFIETAVCHGVISGYSDRTFRSNNSAFRSQIAKIVYLAVTSPIGTCVP